MVLGGFMAQAGRKGQPQLALPLEPFVDEHVSRTSGGSWPATTVLELAGEGSLPAGREPPRISYLGIEAGHC